MDLLHNPDFVAFDTTTMTAFTDYPALALPLAVLVAIVFAGSSRILAGRIQATNPGAPRSAIVKALHGYITALVCAVVLILIKWIDFDFSLFICFVLLPIAAFVTAVSAIRAIPFYKAFERGMSLLANGPGKFIVCLCAFSLVTVVFHFACQKAVSMLSVDDALSWILTDDHVMRESVESVMFALQTSLSLGIYCVLSSLSSVLLYYSLHESSSAEALLKRIRSL
jgi:hypothetical protein